MAKFDVKAVNWKKVGTFGLAILAGAGALMESLADQKREAEFKELQEVVAKLKGDE